MASSPREKVVWSIGILLVVLFALIPVAWIVSLSLKSPDTIGDGKLLPHATPRSRTTPRSSPPARSARRSCNSLGIAAIATFISIVLASMAAYALARLEFAGQGGDPLRRARDRDVPADLDHRLAVRPLAPDRALRHLGRAHHPLHDLHPPAGDLHALGLLPRDPVRARAGRADRRGHAVPGLPQGHRAARRARRVHRRDPRLHLRLERLPLRHHAHLDRQLADRARGARVLHRAARSSRTRPARSRPRRSSSPCRSSSSCSSSSAGSWPG